VLVLNCKKKRTTKQTQRANPIIQKDSIEQYYQITMFLPYVDYFISQLTERFINHKNIFEDIYIFDCIPTLTL
jgi:hypothetical protein